MIGNQKGFLRNSWKFLFITILAGHKTIAAVYLLKSTVCGQFMLLILQPCLNSVVQIIADFLLRKIGIKTTNSIFLEHLHNTSLCTVFLIQKYDLMLFVIFCIHIFYVYSVFCTIILCCIDVQTSNFSRVGFQFVFADHRSKHFSVYRKTAVCTDICLSNIR